MKEPVKRICVISQGYPTAKRQWFTFLDSLLVEFSKCNIECTVISPQSITKCIIKPSLFHKTKWTRYVENGNSISVFQPYYFTYSNKIKSLIKHSEKSFAKKVIRAFERLPNKTEFDVIYGHFWFCGLIAAQIGEKYNIPVFVACGESKIDYSSLVDKLKFCKSVSGVICVSSKSRNECIDLGLCKDYQCGIFPNAVDHNIFMKKDQKICKHNIGVNEEDFVVSFLGSFTDRKGSNRLSKALERLDNVKSIFIGEGSEKPTCPNIIYAGPLKHDKIADYLCASDVFVLPTLNEGCCNAIIEAMACGLPIVSSDREFNYDIIDSSNAFLIDPQSVDEIENSIRTIAENTELRERMGRASIEKAAEFSIDLRAKRILEFIEEKRIGFYEKT